MTIGSPASTRRITGAAKCPLISASPEASACSTPTVPAVGVYCTWEKPSARSSSSAIHSGKSEEHTSELQSPDHLVCRLLLEKKKKYTITATRYVRPTAS